MSSALKVARRYKDIYSFIHINRTTFWADTYFSGSESRMQLQNAYASKEWQMNLSLKTVLLVPDNLTVAREGDGYV